MTLLGCISPSGIQKRQDEKFENHPYILFLILHLGERDEHTNLEE